MIPKIEIQNLAQELLRRRTLTQQKNGHNDLMNAICQTTVLARYGKQPSVDDLKFNKDYLDFITKDNNGRTIRIISAKESENFKVWANQLDVDRLIFVEFSSKHKQANPVGWMVRKDVEELPVCWFERDGKKISYYHMIDKNSLNSLNDEFNFPDSCTHPVAIWIEKQKWSCLKCDKMVFESNANKILLKYGKLDAGTSN